MSMSHYGNYADIVKEEFVKEIASNEYDILINLLESEEIELSEFAENAMFDSIENQEINNAWIALQDKFEKTTGLTLSIQYHDEENASSGDDIFGVFWEVGNVYVLSNPGKKYKDKIERSCYTTWG